MAAISTTDLYNAYLAYFGRPPDLAGLSFFSTKTEAEVMAAFSASPESQELLKGSSLEDSVNNVYLNLFNRNAEFDGLVYWVNQITTGVVTLAEASMAILRGALNEDLDTVNAKNDAMVAFVAAIDTTPEAIGYNGMEAAADARGFIATVGYHWVETATGPELDGNGLSVPTSEEVDAAVLTATTANVVADVDQELFLVVSQDSLMGGIANDAFIADIVQNQLGAQVNTLGTGDRLNGSEGNDVLEAQITEGANFGGLGMPIQPRTTDIETAKFEAVNSHIGYDQVGTDVNLDLADIIDALGGLLGQNGPVPQIQIDGPSQIGGGIPDSITILNLDPVYEVSTTEVYVNAKDMLGVENLWSWHSDANLTVQNLTTQTDAGNHTARAVDTMTIGMGYTGNDDSKWEESDMHVYFDQDYLNPSLTSTEVSVNWQLMNEDGYDVDPTEPLAGVYLRLLQFTLNGTEYDFVPFLNSANLQNTREGNGTLVTTYPEMTAALQAALELMKAANPGDLALQAATIELAAPFTADRNPVTGILRVGTEIKMSIPGLQADGVTPNTLIALDVGAELGRTLGEDSVANNNRWEQADDTPPTLDQELRINVALEKAGNAGEGGELVIGSMSKEAGNNWDDATAGKGIQIFDVTVYGDESRSSNLSGLYSTNNTLREVYVVSEDTSFVSEKAHADLTIGNDNTKVGADSNGDGYGLKDVRKFDSTKFLGDVTLNAVLTAETIEKYQDLVDTQDDDAVDDVLFSYLLGAGNDNLTLTIDGGASGFVVAGLDPSARHDFDFLVDGGAGDDNLTVIMPDLDLTMGNPFFSHPAIPAPGNEQNWYNDQQINENITVNGGAGNDTIRTPGAGDMFILGGTGNDTIYSDNTGFEHANILAVANPNNGEIVYNDGRAVWVLNAVPGEVEIYDIESLGARSVKAVNAQVTVTYRDIAKTVSIGNSVGALSNVTISDLTVNQAIKNAINNDPVLSKLMVAEDGAGRSLVVRSLIDGEFDNARYEFDISELQISFNTVALNAAQLLASPPVTLFSAATGYNGVVDGFTDEQFATNFGDDLNGEQSYTSTDNTITGGDGNDVIVLSTTEFGSHQDDYLEGSNETVVYAPAFGADTIVNFDSTWVPAGEPVWDSSSYEVITLTFSSSDGDPAAETIIFDGTTVTLAAPTTQGVIPVEDVTSQFANQFDSTNWEVTGFDAVAGTVELTHKTPGAVTDVAPGDLTGTYFSGGLGTVGVTIDTDAVDNSVAGSLSTFTVTYTTANTAAVSAVGADITFAGSAVDIVTGDGALTVATKVAAGTYTGWTAGGVVDNGDGVSYSVTFTAAANGATAIGTAAEFMVSANSDGVNGSVGGTVGVADTTVPPALIPAPAPYAGEGYDILDFTALGGDITTQTDLTTVVATNKSIHVFAVAAGVNDSAATLKATLDASVLEDGSASSHVVVVYNSSNVGSVYQVADGAGANDTVVTLAGTIDLADTPWGTLHTVNFV